MENSDIFLIVCKNFSEKMWPNNILDQWSVCFPSSPTIVVRIVLKCESFIL